MSNVCGRSFYANGTSRDSNGILYDAMGCVVKEVPQPLSANADEIAISDRLGIDLNKLDEIKSLDANRVKQKINPGVGMPQALMLHEFGSQVWSAFGDMPYHVGSSLLGKTWRDVDVRLILHDAAFAEMFPNANMNNIHSCGKWVALCLAFSALGKQITGLPIDFQIQQMTHANGKHSGPRSALGNLELRYKK